MLIQIKDSTTKAEARQAEAEAKEKELEVDSARIAIEKQEAEAALEEALPALAEAAEALDNLRKEDITELKSFAKPAQLVQDVCSCVVILKGYKDPSWKGSKLMMNDELRRSLVEFEKDSLTDKQIKQVKQFFQQADFTAEAARDKSLARRVCSSGCTRSSIIMASRRRSTRSGRRWQVRREVAAPGVQRPREDQGGGQILGGAAARAQREVRAGGRPRRTPADEGGHDGPPARRRVEADRRVAVGA